MGSPSLVPGKLLSRGEAGPEGELRCSHRVELQRKCSGKAKGLLVGGGLAGGTAWWNGAGVGKEGGREGRHWGGLGV